MSKLSFIEKLRILFDLSKNSGLYIIVLILLIFVGIIFATTNKKNEKQHKKIYIIITISILLILLITYHASLSKLFQYMMDNFFIVLYFPNLAIYFAALIAMNIILWISIFNYKSSKYIKTLNITIYIIMNYLLLLLLGIVSKNNLDIFTQKSIYSNKNATALIELSSTLFILWIIFLIIYKVILIYLRKDYQPKVKKIVVKKKIKKLPENYTPLSTPDYIYGKAPHKKVQIIRQEVKVPSQATQNSIDNVLTIDDYKTVLKLLESQKIKKQQENIIRKELYQQQQKYDKLIKEQRDNEKEKYEQLLDLYR